MWVGWIQAEPGVVQILHAVLNLHWRCVCYTVVRCAAGQLDRPCGSGRICVVLKNFLSTVLYVRVVWVGAAQSGSVLMLWSSPG
jgi:hypothetical protein